MGRSTLDAVKQAAPRSLFFAIVLCRLAVATNYYVDSVAGSDSNNGVSPASPWQTISKVNSPGFSYAAGDSILFKCGSAWTQGTSNFAASLTTPNAGSAGNPIIYGNYASSVACTSATLPILDGNGVLSPTMKISQDNITVNGLWFKNANATLNGDLLDYSGSTNIKILNSTFTNTAWSAIISQTQLNTTAFIDGNTCNADTGHVQLRGCVLAQGPGTTTVTHNLVDWRNIDTVHSGSNVIGLEVDGSSTSAIQYNTIYGGTQGVTFKPGSCPTGGTPGVGSCYKRAVSGGIMSDNYIWGIKRFGNPGPPPSCTGVKGDGEAIEMEGAPAPYPQTGVTVARNIVVGVESTNGVSGNVSCTGTSDASGTYYSSDYFYGNIIICPCGTYNAFHFGGKDAAQRGTYRFFKQHHRTGPVCLATN